MKEEQCASLGCARKVTNTIKWRDAMISVPLCAEHLVAFSNSTMEVTTEIVPEWRQPDKAEAVLIGMLDQAESLLQACSMEGAKEAKKVVKMAHDHIANCALHGIHLDTSRYNIVVERIANWGQADQAEE